MRAVILTFAACAVGAIGCARRMPLDVMSMPAACDSVPPSVTSAPRRPAQIPSTAVIEGRGAVVGAVVEAGSGLSLGYGDASLQSARDTAVTHRSRVDSLGGFSLVDLAPGGYTLRVRAINHRYEQRHVDVHAGAVDTVRAELQYYACHGY